MLKNILPLALAAAIGFGSAAQAFTDTGTISNVNEVTDTVTLTDGTSYAFDNADYADRLKSFKPGDTVSIAWHHVGSKLEAASISPMSSAY